MALSDVIQIVILTAVAVASLGVLRALVLRLTTELRHLRGSIERLESTLDRQNNQLNEHGVRIAVLEAKR